MRKETFICFTKVELNLRMSCGITSYFLYKTFPCERSTPWLVNKTDLQVDKSKIYLR